MWYVGNDNLKLSSDFERAKKVIANIYFAMNLHGFGMTYLINDSTISM